jgi:hypothetical protein
LEAETFATLNIPVVILVADKVPVVIAPEFNAFIVIFTLRKLDTVPLVAEKVPVVILVAFTVPEVIPVLDINDIPFQLVNTILLLEIPLTPT